MHHLRVKLLQLQDHLPVGTYSLFVVDVFEFCVLHVNEDDNLIDAFFIDKFLAVWEFYAPSVLQFLYQVVHQQIH